MHTLHDFVDAIIAVHHWFSHVKDGNLSTWQSNVLMYRYTAVIHVQSTLKGSIQVLRIRSLLPFE